MQRPLGLLIIGMHRSGTSLVSRLLNLMGAAAPKLLLGPTPANESGHWESEIAYDLNEKFFREIGSTWSDWSPLDRSSETAAARESLIQGGVTFLKQDFADANLFVLKDPRFCRLLPEWLDVFRRADVEPRAVLPIRNPLNVVASLAARDNTGFPSASFMWLRNVLEAEFTSRNLRRVFVSYDEILADWRSAAIDIGKSLDVSWPREVDTIAEAVDEFIRVSRRHHTFADHDFYQSQEVHPWVKSAYRLLQRLREGDLDLHTLASLDDLREEFDSIAQAVRPIVMAQVKGDLRTLNLEYNLTKAGESRSDLASRLVDLNNRHQALEVEYQTQGVKETSLKNELSQAKVKLTRFEDALQELTLLTATHANLRARNEDAVRDREASATENSALRARIDHLTAALSKADTDFHVLQDRFTFLEGIESEVAELREANKTILLEANAKSDQSRLSLQDHADEMNQLRAEMTVIKQKADQFTALDVERSALKTEMDEVRKQRDLAQIRAWIGSDAIRITKANRRHRENLYLRATEIYPNGWAKVAAAMGLRRPLKSQIKVAGSAILPWKEWKRVRAIIAASGLFDSDWYLAAYPEVRFLNTSPLDHYIFFGAFEGRDPGPLFQGRWYLESNSYLRNNFVNPLLHYLQHGVEYGLFPNVVFGTTYYLEKHPDVAKANINPLVHFAREGFKEGRSINRDFDLDAYTKAIPGSETLGMSPLEHLLRVGIDGEDVPPGVSRDVVDVIRSSGLFDTSYYREQSPETSIFATDPLFDYVVRGARLGKKPHRLFDTAYYLDQNPDVQSDGMNPFFHFLRYGWREGRSPHPLFDTKLYAKRYPEVAEAKVNPLLHFVRHGWKGTYAPHAFFDIKWYVKNYPEVIEAKRNPLLDYLISSPKVGRWPHPDFDPEYYRRTNPDVGAAGLDPFIHFVLHGEKEGRLNTALNRRFRVVSPLLAESIDLSKRDIKTRGDYKPYWSAPKWAKTNSLLRKLGGQLRTPSSIPSTVIDEAREALRLKFISVSVIMPAWNRAHVLTAAVDSVFAQIYPVHELIIIDDGSSDGTPDLVRGRYANLLESGKLKLIARPHEGLCQARNAGLEVASGELVAYLDSDNTWHPLYTLLMSALFAQTPQLGTAYCGEHTHDAEKTTTEYLGEPFDRPRLVGRNYIDLNCFVHRHRLTRNLGNFDTQLTRLVDWDLIIRFTRHSPPAFMPICLVDYYLDKHTLNNVTFSENWSKNFDIICRKHHLERLKLNAAPIRLGYVVWDWPALSQTFVVNELRWLIKEGFEVKVYFSKDPDRAAVLDFTVESERVSSPEELADAIRRDRRTVLHSPFAYPATTLLTWPAARLTNLPFTFMPGGVDICHHQNRLRNRVGEVSSDPLCLGVITLGTFHRSFLAEAGVPMSKMVMERQAVGLPSFKPQVFRRDRPRLIAIGRFIEKKGLVYLIAAAKSLSDCDISLFGYGPLDEELRAQVRDEGLTNVTFAGTLDDISSLHAAYYDADLFVLPCVEAENGDMDGLPTVLLEAMAAGLPVVTNRIANIPDLIVDGVFGFLAEPGVTASLVTSIRRALALCEADRDRLIDKAVKRAKSYASDRQMMSTLLDIWKSRSIDIVLVTYDTPDYADSERTLEIIDRIYSHTTMPFNLVVVDNGSQGSFLIKLDERYGTRPNFNLIKLESNRFVGPGTNIGIDAGSSEYIIYLCSKEAFILQNGWDLQIVQAMDANPQAAAGGYLISLPHFRDGEEYSRYSSFNKWRNQDFARANPARRMRHLQGGILVIRRSVYDTVGGFSEAVPHDGTDIEYSYYLESCGYELLDISNVYSVTVKTWPGAGTLVDENATVMHALDPEEAQAFSALTLGSSFRCNLCGFQGTLFNSDSLRRDCISCGSSAFERSAMRHLSLSGVLQRRPKVLCVGSTVALKQALLPVCKTAMSMNFDELRVDMRLSAEPIIVVLDFDAVTSSFDKDIFDILVQLAVDGHRLVYGGNADYSGPLTIRIEHAGVVVHPLTAASNSLSLDTQPISCVGFPATREMGEVHPVDAAEPGIVVASTGHASSKLVQHTFKGNP